MRFEEIRCYPDFSAWEKHSVLLDELREVFDSVDASRLFVKSCREKARTGRMLFCPRTCNKQCKAMLREKSWSSHKHRFRYDSGNRKWGSYEVDFLKDRVACELQFGKYAFMPDNVMKFEIFNKFLKIIDLGVLIVPSKRLQFMMSSGPGCFQQIVQRLDDLEYGNPLVVIGLGV